MRRISSPAHQATIVVPIELTPAEMAALKSFFRNDKIESRDELQVSMQVFIAAAQLHQDRVKEAVQATIRYMEKEGIEPSMDVYRAMIATKYA